MAEDQNLEGGCFCGAVRYRLLQRPMFTHCCHCRECQKRTGSAFVINMIIETQSIEQLGCEPVAVRVPTNSGRPHDIFRCQSCETAVWSDYGARPWLRFVRAGTLDEASVITPDVHIFTETKLPWVQLTPDVMAFPEYYDMEAVWPAESWTRRVRASKSGHSPQGRDTGWSAFHPLQTQELGPLRGV